MKPFIAIFAVVCVGLLGIWFWQSGDLSNQSDNSNNQPNSSSSTPSGIEFESKPLLDLPEARPKYLWPLGGKRISSTIFPVIWQTDKPSECRLLVKISPKVWKQQSVSYGTQHVTLVDFSEFQSEVTFCIEFQKNEMVFRSRPRTVVFGNGAWFSKREYFFDLDNNDTQSFILELNGSSMEYLTMDSFKSALFPDDVKIGNLAPKDEKLSIVIFKASEIGNTTYGYVEVLDAVTNTVDRCRVILRKNKK